MKVKFVYFCCVCHVRTVAVGDVARQLLELIERAEASSNIKEIQTLTTCNPCQAALREGNQSLTRRTSEILLN